MRPSRLAFTIPLAFTDGRGDRTRTCDLKVPNFARYQLCYTPKTVIIHLLRGRSQPAWPPACLLLDFFSLRLYDNFYECHACRD